MSTDGRIVLQPAYVLHRKPYRDTSLLIEAFVRDFGRIGLISRGGRRGRSSLQAVLQPFQPLLLSWSGRGELHTLTATETDGTALALQGDALISGFYLNELAMRLLPRDDPHPVLYSSYCKALEQLKNGLEEEWTLRLFERDLLQELGYGLQLSHDANTGQALMPEQRYCYHPEYGPQLIGSANLDCLAVQGATLLALDSGQQPEALCRREAKRLMRTILQRYLGPRPLASRELFKARYAYTRQVPMTNDHDEE